MDIEKIYKKLMLIENLSSMSIYEAKNYIGQLVDISFDLKREEGLKKAIKLNEELLKGDLPDKYKTILNYFMANAWSNLRILTRDMKALWEWEQKEIEDEILYLRKAIEGKGFSEIDTFMRCQILTNLGNILSHIGRFIEAIEYWNKALEIDPSFSMAIGNKGYGLVCYALSLYDLGHRNYILKNAYSLLKNELDLKLVHSEAQKLFRKKINLIASILPEKFLNKKLDFKKYSLGDSKEEKEYRKWCLEKILFLNPLNDLGSFSIAAQDIFNLPNITTGIDEGPYYIGFFNQMKQEYVSARYLYYEGINFNKPHFSDKDVYLYNTLDYPIYSLGIEKVKVSFRIVYSLFKENWPLRGLFWLSKDLLSCPDYIKAIDPDAREIAKIRNHLEHKYLKIHDTLWRDTSSDNDFGFNLKDSLAFSMYREEFELKTLKLIKLARAALIYLSLAVHTEEYKRDQEKEAGKVMPTQLEKYDDDWKI
jgi:tetratricopeptide (TPR) repeat protein